MVTFDILCETVPNDKCLEIWPTISEVHSEELKSKSERVNA